MEGGTYTVVRRIRITLEHWDNIEVGFQEQVFGRHKYSGAPIGKKNESDPVDLKEEDKDGNPVIPENSHVRLSNQATNNGAQILRRSYSYNEGTNFYIERWPPWRQETEYDAGLIFLAHQSDPRKGFIPINEKLAKFDMMNQFTTHVGSAVFAVPAGREAGFVYRRGAVRDVMQAAKQAAGKPQGTRRPIKPTTSLTDLRIMAHSWFGTSPAPPQQRCRPHAGGRRTVPSTAHAAIDHAVQRAARAGRQSCWLKTSKSSRAFR